MVSPVKDAKLKHETDGFADAIKRGKKRRYTIPYWGRFEELMDG